MTDDEKLQSLLSDEAFAKQILELETPAEVVKLLGEKGVVIPESTVVAIRNKIAEGVSEELDEEALEQVSGGSITLATVAVVAGVAAGVMTLATKVDSWTRRRW